MRRWYIVGAAVRLYCFSYLGFFLDRMYPDVLL
jgi:hypothetical protein